MQPDFHQFQEVARILEPKVLREIETFCQDGANATRPCLRSASHRHGCDVAHLLQNMGSGFAVRRMVLRHAYVRLMSGCIGTNSTQDAYEAKATCSSFVRVKQRAAY
jgi:hypothetical protein